MIAVGVNPADAETIVKSRATHPILDYRELGPIQTSLGMAGQRLRIGGNTMFTLRATARMRGRTASCPICGVRWRRW